MDGLPITEKTGLPFACKAGAMHACGHDMHTTMLLGCAELLKNHESELPCKVRLLFQPAEEILEGAKDCIKNGGRKLCAVCACGVCTYARSPTGCACTARFVALCGVRGVLEHGRLPCFGRQPADVRAVLGKMA